MLFFCRYWYSCVHRLLITHRPAHLIIHTHSYLIVRNVFILTVRCPLYLDFPFVVSFCFTNSLSYYYQWQPMFCEISKLIKVFTLKVLKYKIKEANRSLHLVFSQKNMTCIKNNLLNLGKKTTIYMLINKGTCQCWFLVYLWLQLVGFLWHWVQRRESSLLRMSVDSFRLWYAWWRLCMCRSLESDCLLSSLLWSRHRRRRWREPLVGMRQMVSYR